MRQIILFLTFLLCFSGSAAAELESDFREYIQKGNHNYLEGKYEEALNFYQKAEKLRDNGYLHYNIGNCYYRLRKKGEALANYKRAQRHIPSFQDLKANIGYIKGERIDDIEDAEPFRWVKKVYFFHDMVSAKKLALISLILLGITLGAFLLKLFLHKQQFKWIALIAAFFFLIFTSSSALKYYEYTFLDFGVVTPDEIEVKSERSESSVTLFKLHAATHFQILSESEDWLYIELSTGKRGWLKRSDAAII